MSSGQLTVMDVQNSLFWQNFPKVTIPGIAVRTHIINNGMDAAAIGVPLPAAHLEFSGQRLLSEYGQEAVLKLLETLKSPVIYLELIGKNKIHNATSAFIWYLESKAGTKEGIAAAKNCHYLAASKTSSKSLRTVLKDQFWNLNLDSDVIWARAITEALIVFASPNLIEKLISDWPDFGEITRSQICQTLSNLENLENNQWTSLANKLQEWLTPEVCFNLDPSNLRDACEALARLNPEQNLPILAQLTTEMAIKKDINRFLSIFSSIKSIKQRMPILRETICWLLSGSSEVKDLLVEVAVGA